MGGHEVHTLRPGNHRVYIMEEGIIIQEREYILIWKKFTFNELNKCILESDFTYEQVIQARITTFWSF